VLKRQLDGLSAELVVCARSRADVVRTLAAAWRFGVPITARGGGTGTHGQAVPLAGGAVLDLTRLDRILWAREGSVRVEAGATLINLERTMRERGWELRVFPSAKRQATAGGFVCGGNAGIGSVHWGTLGDPGNLIAAEIVTLEAVPRFIELRGAATGLVSQAFGTTGVVLEVELPLAGAVSWRDVAIAFDDFIQGATFCLTAAGMPGIDCRLVSMVESTIVSSFKGLRERAATGESLAMLMVAPSGLVALSELAAAHGGRIVLETGSVAAEAGAGATPIYEYSWNHATLQMLKHDPSITYLDSLFPQDDPLERVSAMRQMFGDELPMHLEFLRMGDGMRCRGMQIVRFTTEARLAEIIRIHEENGVLVANPHAYTIEDGDGPKQRSDNQRRFKHEVDPLGLLNPGKMRDYVPAHLTGTAAE
jgi:FAD/FMN-containing dehydrogenase